MSKAIPDNSPLLYNWLVCSGCGQIVKPEIVKNFGGKVEGLKYSHINKEFGCSYTLNTNAMIQAEMRPLRADGSEAKIP